MYMKNVSKSLIAQCQKHAISRLKQSKKSGFNPIFKKKTEKIIKSMNLFCLYLSSGRRK